MARENMQEPRYQVMPALSDEEFDALKADIAKRGVMVPIEFDEDGNVLDGHHRLRACEELGITDYPRVVREGMSEDEKVLHALTLNAARRHLTREQKAEAVKSLLRRDPSLSDRKIAAAVGVSHPTVGKYRRQMNGEEPVVSFTTPKEPKEGRGTFTCCICGKEAPAYYTRRRDGKLVNSWGYNPWPLQIEGDCCGGCNLKLMNVRTLLPHETWKEHLLGPQWRELLEAAKEADERLGRTLGDWDSFDEFEEEFERILAERGILYDPETDWYTRTPTALAINAIDDAAERGDVATMEAIRDMAGGMEGAEAWQR